jgi:hypothetical protein
MKVLALWLVLLALTAPAWAQTTIIYSRADAAQAQRAYQLLQTCSVPFMDTDLRPGSPWRSTMVLAICHSRTVLLVWSKRAAASTEVARELQAAQMCAVPVVPLLLDSTPLPADVTLQGADWR